MKVKVKKLVPEAVIPHYQKSGDAGLDLTAVRSEGDGDGNVVYYTGLAFEIPEGYVGLLFPRSSNAKKDLVLTNHVGVVDSGYRGEVMLKYRPHPIHGTPVRVYEVGERVGQLLIIPYPQIELEEATMLTESERGAGGYGSTNS